MNDKYHMPQYLDEPFKFILWTIDELIVLFGTFILCMVCFNSPIFGLIVGSILLLVLKKIKGEQGHFFIYHLMYWFLPNIFKLNKTPPSYIRQWLG